MIYYESSYTGVTPLNGNYLMHYGTKGQKKGVRRWQNEDGSYTAAGAANGGRYAQNSEAGDRREAKLAKYKTKENKKLDKRYDKKIERLAKKANKYEEKYQKLAEKGASDRKLDRVADKYTKYNVQQINRRASKAAEKERVDSATYKSMKREKAKIGAKTTAKALARAGAITVGTMGLGAIPGAAYAAGKSIANRGRERERARISIKRRKQIQRSSATQAAMDRARLERARIKRRR